MTFTLSLWWRFIIIYVYFCLDDDAFAKIRLMDGKKVYYFTAEWCPPCRRIGPVLEEIAKEYPDMLFVKINIDNMPLSAQYGERIKLDKLDFFS